MFKFIVLLTAAFFTCANLASNYHFIEKDTPKAADSVIQTINQQGYEWWGEKHLTHNYMRVRKGDTYTLADQNGNIIQQAFDFVTPMSRKGIFFAGTNKDGIRRADYKINLQSYDRQGNLVATEMSQYDGLMFSQNQSKRTKFSSSVTNDYVSVTALAANGYDVYEGLIDASGKIVIEPENHSVDQIIEDYFFIQTKDGNNMIVNLRTGEQIGSGFQELKTIDSPQNLKSIYAVYDRKVLAKAGNYYGIYDLNNKSWHVNNEYDKLQAFTGTELFTKDPIVTKRVIYSDNFLAQKNGKWGLIDKHTNIKVPFKYAHVEKGSGKYIKVYDQYSSSNYKKSAYSIFDPQKQNVVIPGYHMNIVLFGANERFALMETADKKAAVYDIEAQETLVDFAEGYIDGSQDRGEMKLEHRSGRKDVFSTSERRVLNKTAAVVGSGSIETEQVVASDSLDLIARSCSIEKKPSRKNIALDAEVEAGSTYCSGSGKDCYAVKRIIDGDISTDLGGYTSWVNQPGKSKDIIFTWNEDLTVQQIQVFTTSGYPISDYKIMVQSGGNWSELVSTINNTDTSICHAFDPLSISAMKFVGLKGPSKQKAFTRVNEIQVF